MTGNRLGRCSDSPALSWTAGDRLGTAMKMRTKTKMTRRKRRWHRRMLEIGNME